MNYCHLLIKALTRRDMIIFSLTDCFIALGHMSKKCINQDQNKLNITSDCSLQSKLTSDVCHDVS